MSANLSQCPQKLPIIVGGFIVKCSSSAVNLVTVLSIYCVPYFVSGGAEHGEEIHVCKACRRLLCFTRSSEVCCILWHMYMYMHVHLHVDRFHVTSSTPKFKITGPQKFLSSSGVRDLNLHLFTAFQPMSMFGKLGIQRILNFGVRVNTNLWSCLLKNKHFSHDFYFKIFGKVLV